MSTQPIPTLKEKFSDGKTPPGHDFSDLIDSFWHKSTKIPATQIENINGNGGGLAPILDNDFFSDSRLLSVNSGSAIKVGTNWTNIISSSTGRSVNYQLVERWKDGTLMDASKVDGTIYRLRGDEFLKLAIPMDWIDAEIFGAVGDGVTDDTAALTRAFAFGGNIRLGKRHKISSSISLTKDINIKGDDSKTEIVAPSDIQLFNSTAQNIDISNLITKNNKGILHQTVNFGEINIHHCSFTGVDETVTNYFVDVNVDLSGTRLLITNNNLNKCTIFFTDRFKCEDLIVDYNYITDGTRFLVRSLPSHGSDPLNAQSPKRISFCYNYINGINTALTDKSTYARVLQASAIEKITMNDNYIYHLNTSEAATVLYWSFGSLDFFRNTVRRIEGREGGVHDKSNINSSLYGYRVNCGYNTFDQSEIGSENQLETIYKIYALSNFITNTDTFIGCRCPAYRIYQSVDVGITPENFTFRNAEVYDHKYPVIVQIIQQCKNVNIEGFKVNKISNPDNLAVNGESRLRLADLYMTFDNEKGIENILIQKNDIIESSNNFVFLMAYKNAVSTTGFIRNVFVKGNTTLQSEALCRFINGQDLGYFLFADNNSTTSAVSVGVTPPDMALSNNLPKPSLNYALPTGTLAAGATRRIVQAVTNTSLGDFVKASLSIGIANVSIAGNVPSNNNVEVFITNTSASPITIPDCMLFINVDKR